MSHEPALRGGALGPGDASTSPALCAQSVSTRDKEQKYFREIMEYIMFFFFLNLRKNPHEGFLFQDDPEWCWVLRSDGHEGFVPAGFIYPLDAIQKQRRCQLQPLSAIS